MKDITFAPSSTDDLEAARSSPLSLNISSHHRILARHDTHVTNATGTNAAKMPLRPPLVEESDESNFSRFTDGLNEMVENEQDESRSTVPKIAFGLSRTIKIVRVTALSVLTTTALLVSTMTYFLASQKYRSDEIESQISSSDPALNASNPALFTSIVAALFTLTIILFLGYHRMVERRHRVVLSQALKSTAIVASLFPERVHHRLLETATKQTKTRKTSAKTNSFNDEDLEENDCSLSSEYSERLEKVKVKDPSKMKLKEILRDKTQTDGSLLEELQPIADFFPNCTVMFADIVGFTAWSSSREPTQVFTLLQSIYQEFDKAARKRRVFKVETIGDSYVAVTGLPDPQDDHAMIMAGFALECRKLMRDVCRRLERSLGPDTGDLCMRIGLHSGPVTAGVLRGEKSRFQLFGDTVNTAARMESNGAANCIHLSRNTADLIELTGKGQWLTPREDEINCKGKGTMQTYWFEVKNSKRMRRMSLGTAFQEFASTTKSTLDISTHSEAMVRPDYSSTRQRDLLRHQHSLIWGSAGEYGSVDSLASLNLSRYCIDSTARLIDWNANVLSRLLKQVVAKRNYDDRSNSVKRRKSSTTSIETLVSTEEQRVFLKNQHQNGSSFLDEVKEIINIPANSCENPQNIDADAAVLDDAVERQLRDFVHCIASSYRDNPFHNYEHACHVQLSMLKLLEHVTTPEDIDHNEGLEAVALHAHVGSHGIASDPLVQFTVVFSGLIHDVDHTGVSNTQLVKEQAAVAIAYNGKCVAEQNSIDLAWTLLMKPAYEELRGCIYSNQAEFTQFRQLVVNVVLATDIFDKELSVLRKKRWSKAFGGACPDETYVDIANRKATIMIEHLIQASDVAHTMQHFDVYLKWNKRLFHEMVLSHRSGRTELDPSSGWYEGELVFFDNYIIPLARNLKECEVFGASSDECLTYAMANRARWETEGEQIVADMLATDFSTKSNEHSSTRESKQGRRRKVALNSFVESDDSDCGSIVVGDPDN